MLEFVQATARQIADDYVKRGVDPTESLVKVAQMGKLSAHQIERIATGANRKILVSVNKGEDPHQTFPTIKTAAVLAILTRKRPSAHPSLPPSSGGWLDVSPRPELASRVGESVEGMASQKTFEFPDKGMALMVLKHLKAKASMARSKASQAEMMFDVAISKLCKEAQPYLMRNEPLTPLQKLPGNAYEHLGPMVEKMASMGYRNEELSEEFELDEAHPIFKAAEAILDVQKEIESAKEEFEHADSRVKAARFIIRKKGWM
jgi:hypothetical protein